MNHNKHNTRFLNRDTFNNWLGTWRSNWAFKVQLFLEGHKNLRNLPHALLIYLLIVNVQTMRKIVQIFVAFSEKLNFTSNNLGLIWALKHTRFLLLRNWWAPKLVKVVKVSQFQNVFLVPSFRPKNQQNLFKNFCPTL